MDITYKLKNLLDDKLAKSFINNLIINKIIQSLGIDNSIKGLNQNIDFDNNI